MAEGIILNRINKYTQNLITKSISLPMCSRFDCANCLPNFSGRFDQIDRLTIERYTATFFQDNIIFEFDRGCWTTK